MSTGMHSIYKGALDNYYKKKKFKFKNNKKQISKTTHTHAQKKLQQIKVKLQPYKSQEPCRL